MILSISLVCGLSRAQEVAPQTLYPPLAEIEHPRYTDAVGTQLTWGEIRDLSSSTDALRDVRHRKLGRTLVRTMFIAASTAEIWGTWQLARDQRWLAYPLGAQATVTSLCAVLSFTAAPQDRVEDRAIVLRGANQAVMRR